MNPYQSFVSSFAKLAQEGKSLPTGGIPAPPKPALPADAPVALIFSPHPDDECIIGGFALRLMREAGVRIVNVAVTLGSRLERQQPRLGELRNACDWIGFDLELAGPERLGEITTQTRADRTEHWAAAVKLTAALLARYQPRVIFFPHEADWHRTHIGTHWLVMDALKISPRSFECLTVETEFWGQISAPNLMVESSIADVADLLAALSFHAGEVRRNPYHLRLPAWFQDNVRRGAELVGGQGGVAPDFTFATLYRLRQWRQGATEDVQTGGKLISVQDDPGSVLRLNH